MADKIPKQEISLQQVAEDVALGASRLALIAGIVAFGASFLAGEKTRVKIADETNGVVGSFRKIISIFSNSQIEDSKK